MWKSLRIKQYEKDHFMYYKEQNMEQSCQKKLFQKINKLN
jgi:hypothetical protein